MKKIINPKNVHRRPNYNQGILVDGGKLLFIAGQTAVDAKGNFVGKGDIEAQARQVYENMKAVLDDAGGSFDDIVKTTIYITDIKHPGRSSQDPEKIFYGRPGYEHPAHYQGAGARRVSHGSRGHRSHPLGAGQKTYLVRCARPASCSELQVLTSRVRLSCPGFHASRLSFLTTQHAVRGAENETNSRCTYIIILGVALNLLEGSSIF